MATADIMVGDPSQVFAAVARSSSRMVGHVFEDLSKDVERYLKNHVRTITPKMQTVANESIAQALAFQAERRVRPSQAYRAGTGKNDRLHGALKHQLSGKNTARVVNGQLQFGNLSAIHRTAKHIYRLNFGTEGGSPPAPSTVMVDGTSFPVPVASLYGRRSERWNMPAGRFYRNQFYPNNAKRVYLTNKGTQRKDAYRYVKPGTPAGMQGQFFMSDAAVGALRGSIAVYKHHVEGLVEKSLKTGRQEFAKYGISVVA